MEESNSCLWPTEAHRRESLWNWQGRGTAEEERRKRKANEMAIARGKRDPVKKWTNMWKTGNGGVRKTTDERERERERRYNFVHRRGEKK
jgi:hypothetical protein